MKTPRDIPDLGAKLTQAATAPLQSTTTTLRVVEKPKAPAKTGSVSVFLRVPAEQHAKLADEATARTKATGKGVTVQQIILERLAGSQ